MTELTIEDIEQAVKQLQQEPERIIYEDDDVIIKSRGLYPTTIQLKSNILALLNRLLFDSK